MLPLVSSSDTTDKRNMTARQKISENHNLADNKHNGMNHLKPSVNDAMLCNTSYQVFALSK